MFLIVQGRSSIKGGRGEGGKNSYTTSKLFKGANLVPRQTQGMYCSHFANAKLVAASMNTALSSTEERGYKCKNNHALHTIF